jgi:hypothetical protein
MLAWPTGARRSDGVWARYWYGSVEASNGFGPPPDDEVPRVPNRLTDVADEAIDVYEGLRTRRLRPDQFT